MKHPRLHPAGYSDSATGDAKNMVGDKLFFTIGKHMTFNVYAIWKTKTTEEPKFAKGTSVSNELLLQPQTR